MGIAKDIEFKNTGIVLTYWRINFVGVDIELNQTQVRVGGYTSKADALAGKKAVDNINYNLLGRDNPINMMTDPREYQALLHTKLISTGIGGGFVTNRLAGGAIVSDLPD